MCLVKRALTSMTRQIGKTALLFFMLIFLGTFVSGAISVSRAIQLAAFNLRRNIPAIATIDHDNDAIVEYIDNHGKWSDWESSLTSDMIEEIGSLPYVERFDYAILSHDFFSRDLKLPHDATPYLETGLEEAIITDWLSQLSLEVEGLEQP